MLRKDIVIYARPLLRIEQLDDIQDIIVYRIQTTMTQNHIAHLVTRVIVMTLCTEQVRADVL